MKREINTKALALDFAAYRRKILLKKIATITVSLTVEEIILLLKNPTITPELNSKMLDVLDCWVKDLPQKLEEK
jgi:hypothetical protein